MSKAMIANYLLNPTGVSNERLGQSAVVTGMAKGTDAAGQIRRWLDGRRLSFVIGVDEETELSDRQVELLSPGKDTRADARASVYRLKGS